MLTGSVELLGGLMVGFAERRRMARERRASKGATYETRREWILGELILGIVSCATAIAGISGGLVSLTLERDGIDGAWFWCFYLSGAAFILLAFIESRCRSHNCGRNVLVRYAHMRLAVHALNFFSWSMAFLWLHFSDIGIASIYHESIPLALLNFWGMAEHAKAVWLKPSSAKSTSIVSFFMRYR